MPGKPKILSETNTPTPSAAAKDTITVRTSSSGATSARSSSARMMNTTTSVSGMITRLSRVADWRRSYSCAVGPPTSTVGPPARLAISRSSRRAVERRRRVGVALQHDREPRARRPVDRLADLGHEVRGALERLRDRRRLGLVGHDHVGRRGRAGREVAREHLLALDGVDLAAERVAARQARVEVDEVQREQHEHHGAADPDRARARRDAVADPAPEAVRLVDARLAEVRDRVEWRPERPPPADRQQRGKDRQHRDHRQADAHRADRAEAGGAVDLGDAQASAARRSRSAPTPGSPGRRCAGRSPSPRACPRAGAAPRGSGRRAAARSRCRRRTRARAGCRRSGR